MLHRLLVILLCYALAIGQAFASQNALTSPTTGTVSGLQLTNNYNNAIDSVNTCNSGASAPTNQLSGAPSLGNCWLNTSTGAVQFYDGANWLTIGYIDATNHIFTPVLGGNAATGVASASTTNLCGASGASPTGAYLTITGTGTITSFGSNCVIGQIKILTFASTATLTYNATSLILPSAANVQAAANDTAVAIYLGGSNWQVLIYQRASGSPLSSSLNFTGAIFVNGAISPSSLSTNQNNYNPSGLAAANVIRQASSAAVNITGLTAPATNGQRITIQNINAVGGFNITLTANDTNSSSGNRFLFPHPIGLQPQQSLTVVYDATAGGWRLEQKVYASPTQGAFKNLRVFNALTVYGDTAPATPNSQIKIAADEVVLEDGNGNSVRASAIACTIDFTINGAGGLDTSSLAAGNWYYAYVIFNASTNTTSCLGSLQNAVPSVTLPSGYAFAARVGADYYLTNGVTGFQRFIQYGRSTNYVPAGATPTPTLPVISNTQNEGSLTVPTWVAKSLAAIVPPTASRIKMVLFAAGAADDAMVAPSNRFGAFNNTAAPAPCTATGATSSTVMTLRCDFNLESSSVYTANNFTSGFLLQAYGWDDDSL